MKEYPYRTRIYDKEHRHYGGQIYPSDFHTDEKEKEHRNGSPIAARIESDFRRENRTIKNGSDIGRLTKGGNHYA